MEYFKISPQQDTFLDFGMWNISQKNGNKKNIEIDGIWNISGISRRNSKTIKILKILEYGIFHRILLEYSEKCKTYHGGLKFNQAIKLQLIDN